MIMTTPKVTTIIVSYNTHDLLAHCLESLLPEVSTGVTSVVVVDNASRDGSVLLVRQCFPQVTVIESSVNLGFAAANNLALRILSTPYALLLNSDTVVSPGTVQGLLDCMERHLRAGAVGCRLLNTDGSLQRSCWRFPTPLRALGEALGVNQTLGKYANYGEWDYLSERPVDFVIGACLLLRKSALDRIGIFDERYFMYAEEQDLCRRFAPAGWETWFTPTCNVIHYGGASSSVTTPSQFLHARELYYAKWYGWPGVAISRLSQTLGATIRVVAFSLLFLWQPRQAARNQVRRNIALLQWIVDSYHQGTQGLRTRTSSSSPNDVRVLEEKLS